MSSDQDSSFKIYFGYGSNLWLHQMRLRCPTSKFLGVARLKQYKWIIYSRGYANIVQLPQSSSSSNQQQDPNDDKTAKKDHDYTHEVWGMVYSLEKSNEARLDVNEGVPRAYQKEMIECEFWPKKEDDDSVAADDPSHPPPEKIKMLVYINRKNTDEAEPKEEYVHRMNLGIKDAVKVGVPRGYVKGVLREWIPEEEDEEGDEGTKELAGKQAAEFRDERR